MVDPLSLLAIVQEARPGQRLELRRLPAVEVEKIDRPPPPVWMEEWAIDGRYRLEALQVLALEGREALPPVLDGQAVEIVTPGVA